MQATRQEPMQVQDRVIQRAVNHSVFREGHSDVSATKHVSFRDVGEHAVTKHFNFNDDVSSDSMALRFPCFGKAAEAEVPSVTSAVGLKQLRPQPDDAEAHWSMASCRGCGRHGADSAQEDATGDAAQALASHDHGGVSLLCGDPGAVSHGLPDKPKQGHHGNLGTKGQVKVQSHGTQGCHEDPPRDWPTTATVNRLKDMAMRTFGMCSRRRPVASERSKEQFLVDMPQLRQSMGKVGMGPGSRDQLGQRSGIFLKGDNGCQPVNHSDRQLQCGLPGTPSTTSLQTGIGDLGDRGHQADFFERDPRQMMMGVPVTPPRDVPSAMTQGPIQPVPPQIQALMDLPADAQLEHMLKMKADKEARKLLSGVRPAQPRSKPRTPSGANRFTETHEICSSQEDEMDALEDFQMEPPQ